MNAVPFNHVEASSSVLSTFSHEKLKSHTLPLILQSLPIWKLLLESILWDFAALSGVLLRLGPQLPTIAHNQLLDKDE